MSLSPLTRRLVIASLAALALAGGAVAQAAAGDFFEAADGDQASACATTIDWACLTAPAGLYLSVSDAVAPDDVFDPSSTKLDDPDGWKFRDDSPSSDKTDIQAAWAAGASPADGHLLEVAFKVRGGGSSAFIGFELTQNPTPYVNAEGTSVLCRSAGDLLISYGIGGGTANLTPNVWRWTVDAGGPAACPGSQGRWVDAPAGAAQLGLNGSEITSILGSDVLPAGSRFAAGTFGEAAIDLDALAPASGCTYFRRMQVTSRTSSSTSATLDDVLPSTGLLAAACRRDTTPPPALQAPGIGAAPTVACAAGGGQVTLSGTGAAGRSDLEVREVFGSAPNLRYTTRAANVPVAGDGTWSAVVGGVADGSHRYVADYALVADTTSAEKAATVDCVSDQGGGGTPGSGSDSTSADSSSTGDSGTGIPGTTSGTTPGPVVAGERLKGCLWKPFRVQITRKKAKRVRFTIDRKVVKTVRRGRRGNHRFSVVVDPLKLKPGIHVIRARITFRGRPKRTKIAKLRRFRSCNATCANRSKFTVRVPKVAGQQVVRAVVRVGKQRRVVRGRALRRPLRLRHLPKGRWTLRWTLRTASGEVVHRKLRYHTCSGRLTRVKPVTRS